MTLCNRLPKRDSFRTSAYGIRGILDIRAIDILAVVSEDRCADAEARVRTIGAGFGGATAGLEGAELGGA